MKGHHLATLTVCVLCCVCASVRAGVSTTQTPSLSDTENGEKLRMLRISKYKQRISTGQISHEREALCCERGCLVLA